MRKLSPVLFLLAFSLLSCKQSAPTAFRIQSPEGKVVIDFRLNAQGQPNYDVLFKDKLVLDTSYLGLHLNQAPDLKEHFQVLRFDTSSFDQTWEQPWGEQHWIRNHYRELKVALQEKSGLHRQMNIEFRVYDDGVGFRYEFPEQDSLKNMEVIDEYTEFNMAGDYSAWWIPAFQSEQFEYLYRNTPLSQMRKVHTPVTFDTGDGTFLSIHEAALKEYTSMVIDACCGKRLKCYLYPFDTVRETRVYITAPAVTPWRTIQLASSPGELITSYLILNLNEPNQLGDVSWFKPGKYVGIWWEMHIDKSTWAPGPRHGATTANAKKYIDFAAKHGFDAVLVEGWNLGWEGDWTKNKQDYTKAAPDYDLSEVNAYAKSKGIYMVGHHETAGNIDNYEKQMPAAFDLLEKYGMKAVKTGYVEHGSMLTNGLTHFGQSYVSHFRKVYMLAANHHIAVIAHEPIHDTGERRTYPNMISREGARGQEYNAWSSDGGNPPSHEEVLPFTRWLSGPMDFTPGVFDITIPSKPHNQVNTTLCKQLALYVTMYSPMQMACDLPEHYDKYPDAFRFIEDVGVDWETTKILEGKIGAYITTARQKRGTDDWFVGSITNENPRDITITLDFLKPGATYTARIYHDGPAADYKTNPESYVINERQVTAADSISLHIAPGGGAAISLIQQKPQ